MDDTSSPHDDVDNRNSKRTYDPIPVHHPSSRSVSSPAPSHANVNNSTTPSSTLTTLTPRSSSLPSSYKGPTSNRTQNMITALYAHEPSLTTTPTTITPGPSSPPSWRGDASNNPTIPSRSGSLSASQPNTPSTPPLSSPSRHGARSASCSGWGSGSSSGGDNVARFQYSYHRGNQHQHAPPLPSLDNPIDMKRLLSKPARPSHSGSETISIPSDPDHFGRPGPRRQSSTSKKPLDESKRAKALGRRATSEMDHSTVFPPSSTSCSPEDSTPSLPTRDRKPSKPRNVLQRKSSALKSATNMSTPNLALPTSGTPSQRASAPPAPKTDSDHLGDSSSAGPRPRWKPPKAPLTPAGEVAYAYKTQRGALSSSASESASASTSPHSYDPLEDDRPKRTRPGKKFDLEGDAWMGTTEQQRHAVPVSKTVSMDHSRREDDDDEDGDAWLREIGARRMGGKATVAATAAAAESKQGPSSHRATETVMPYYTVIGSKSGKVVAVGGPDDDDWDHSGYHSADEKVGGKEGYRGRKLRTRTVSGRWRKPRDDKLGGDPSSGVPSSQDRTRAGGKEKPPKLSLDRFEDLPPSGIVVGEKKQQQQESPLSGGKIWKLVKRISTGGLRERSQNRWDETTPPPVPPLVQAKTIVPASRPSTTTRSSSPLSSEVGSATFFHREQSARSSTSSYGDEIPPPVPQTFVPKHIIPPHELYLQAEEMYSAKTPRDDWNMSPKRHIHSLPVPPRRFPDISTKVISGCSPEDPPPSPPIPTFTTDEAVNNFPAKGNASRSSSSPLRVQIQVVHPTDGSPPPRPSKSPSPDYQTTSGSRSVLAHRETSPKEELSLGGDTRTLRSRVSSRSDASTIRQRPRSNSYGASSATAAAASFRAVESGPRPSLSEREKTARWDDLLERSEKAGGTLHLGLGEGLASDQISILNTTS
jgi:hypothetical protein